MTSVLLADLARMYNSSGAPCWWLRDGQCRAVRDSAVCDHRPVHVYCWCCNAAMHSTLAIGQVWGATSWLDQTQIRSS